MAESVDSLIKELADTKKELDEMKRKIQEMEQNGSSKRQRTGKDEKHDATSDKWAGLASSTSVVVRMRGLPYAATNEEIKAFFEGLEIVAIHFARDHMGRPTGDAFVEFPSEEVASKSMSFHKKHLGSRYIELFRSSSRELLSALNPDAVSGVPTWSGLASSGSFIVRMHGLPFTSTEEDIKGFFEGLEIVAIHIPQDHLGRPTGDAFVEFPSEEAASKSMSFHKKHLGSRYIELFRSSAGELTAAMSRSSFGPGARGSLHDGSMCIRMMGIPFTATETDITRFFREAGVTPVRIHRKRNGGEAFVEFGSSAEAKQAMSLHKHHIGKRYIELYRVSYQEMVDTVGLPRAGGFGSLDMLGGLSGLSGLGSLGSLPLSGVGGLGSSGFSGLSGLSTGLGGGLSGFSGGLGSSSGLATPATMSSSFYTAGTRMKLQGLPYRATPADICEFFKGYDILPETVELGQDQYGRPSGEAWILFRTPESARLAHQEKDHQYIGDRYVKLFLD